LQTEGSFQQALALHKQGKLDEARVLYQQTLQCQPRHFHALNLLGIIALETNRPADAVKLFENAILTNRQFALSGITVANAVEQPNFSDADCSSDIQPVALQADYAAAYYNRGNALIELRQFETAIASYDAAIALKPDLVKAYSNRGNALHELQRFEDAIASYDQALAIQPNSVQAHHNRGSSLREFKRYEEALASYQRAISLEPNLKFLHGQLLHMKMHLCDWQDYDAEVAELSARIERAEAASSPFSVNVLLGSAALQRRAAETWVREKYPAQPAAAILKRSRRAKICLGYFSADYHDHATMHLMGGLFELHDRSQFEVTALSFGPYSEDPMRRRLVAACDEFIDVSRKSDREIAGLARSLQLNIAVDLKGFTQGCRPGIFASRAAPLQVNYLGYPGTMGAGYMDYLIADRTLIAAGAESHYREKILYLPNSYQVNDSQRAIAPKVFSREELGLPPVGFVFCCFNNCYKITPDIFALWMRILRRVEGSVLWLSEDHPAASGNLRREALRRRVSAERLIFAQRLPVSEHLARLRAADLFLDTLPCNAHTTASDALWAGVPVLTRPGETFAGRVAASLLNAVGLPELIALSGDQYEDLAVDLATDAQRLGRLKHRLTQNRLTTPLFDTRRFVRHLEVGYSRIYERYQADLPPEHTCVT